MVRLPGLCFCCRHRGQKGPNGLTCEAFPDGIPEAILRNQVDHRRPVEGDRGITFESREDAPDDILTEIKGSLDARAPALRGV